MVEHRVAHAAPKRRFDAGAGKLVADRGARTYACNVHNRVNALRFPESFAARPRLPESREDLAHDRLRGGAEPYLATSAFRVVFHPGGGRHSGVEAGPGFGESVLALWVR
jgi:hypothetical protein